MSEISEKDAGQSVDMDAIMKRIRAEVEAEIAESGAKMPKYLPPPEKLADGSLEPILYSAELNYLNAHWNEWAEGDSFSSHRPFIGSLILKCKRKLRSFLVETLLKDYFQKEREFQMNLVRYLNATARYVDARDSEIFWQLVTKMDSDVSAMNDRADRLFQEAMLEKNKQRKMG